MYDLLHRLATFWQHLDALARLRLGIIVALLVVGLLAALLGAFLGNDWSGIWLNLGNLRPSGYLAAGAGAHCNRDMFLERIGRYCSNHRTSGRSRSLRGPLT
jgi:hypothetical protein